MVEIPERSHGEQYGPQLLASNQNGQKIHRNGPPYLFARGLPHV